MLTYLSVIIVVLPPLALLSILLIFKKFTNNFTSLITSIPAFVLDVPAYAITSNEAGAINFKFFRPRAVLRFFDC